MKRINVLITAVGSATAISVIKGLRMQNEYDVFIVGTDINDANTIAGVQFCDTFFKVSPANKEREFIEKLVDIIKLKSIDLVIPIVDTELEVISKNKEILEKYTNILISSYKTIMTYNDKYETYKFFLEHNIPTPKTILVESNIPEKILAEINNAGIDFPVIAKPRKGVSSRGVWEIYNEKEIVLVNRIKGPIIQEKIFGQEYTIDVFSDGKKPIAIVPRKRIETRAGISYKGETEYDKTLISIAKKIVKELDIYGPANIQVIKGRDEINVIEVNPRFSGSLPLTIAAGINMPLLAIKLAMGETLDPIDKFKKVRMCRYWEEVFFYE